MSRLYYSAIYPNVNKATALMNAVQTNLSRFEDYLHLACEAQKQKRVSSRWKQVVDKTVQIIPLFQVIEIENIHSIEFEWSDDWYKVIHSQTELKLEKKILFEDSDCKFSFEKGKYILQDSNDLFIKVSEKFDENESIWWNGEGIKLSKIKTIDNDVKIYQDGGQALTIEDVTYDEKVKRYQIKFQGAINTELPLIVNHFPVQHWSLLSSEGGEVCDSKGERLDILESKDRRLYIKKLEAIEKLFINQQPINYRPIDEEPLPDYFYYKNKKFDIINNGKRCVVSDEDNLITKEIRVKKVENSLLEYKVLLVKDDGDKKSLWIELIDEDEDKEDDGNISSFSPLDYFFSEGVDYLEDDRNSAHKNKYKIESANQELRRLLISHANDYKKQLNYSDLSERLYISINTYQIEKQIEALRLLREKPLLEHKPLLSLAEMKEQMKSPWNDFKPAVVAENEWIILVDADREGTEKQREFVEKALATEDFVLLEGPPGSGKTTAIMELIIQLIRRGNRILLSASTHVAIDNVLERLDEKEEYMHGILPLRVGDAQNINDNVKKFQVDQLVGSNEYKELINDAANLVCGTTIGILKHPIFERQSKKEEPVVPAFDYLIVDESSKTTFQEFLVPGLYAKRWILVGDVHQLSPFTEREHLEANFQNVDVKKKTFTDDAQRASLLLFKYIYKPPRKKNPKYCIVEKDSVVESIKKELRAQEQNANESGVNNLPLVIFFGTERESYQYYTSLSLNDVKSGEPISWFIMAADVIFIKYSDLNTLKDFIPSQHLVLNRSDWEEEGQYFRMKEYYSEHTSDIEYYDRGKIERNHLKIIELNNSFLKDTIWAKEIAWRMVRKYELRFSEKDVQWLESDIELLIPRLYRDIVKQKYEVIREIALPSILECLQFGVGKGKESEKKTVLNSGFTEDVKNARYVRLEHQHRMHPEISAFPREQFYKGKALIDSTKLDREWTYDRYPTRNIWIDVNGDTQKGSYNIKEVKKLVNELKAFVEWAVKNPKKSEDNWTVACLTFYRGQERKIREALREYTNQKTKNSQFEIVQKGVKVKIVLYTIDKFQGREADVTFISMTQTGKVGFMDSPNRLNVALTRARYQRVIIGKRDYFATQKQSAELADLVIKSTCIRGEK